MTAIQLIQNSRMIFKFYFKENVQTTTVTYQYMHIAGHYVEVLQRTAKRLFVNNRGCIIKLLVTTCHIAIAAYLGYATFRSFEISKYIYVLQNMDTT